MNITLITAPTLLICVILLFNQYSMYELEDKRYSKFKERWYLGLVIINTAIVIIATLIIP